MSHVPLGAMLSGGLDSSLLVALMAESASGPVETFSVGFTEDAEANELPHARRVAEAFRCNHHDLELSLRDSAVDLSNLVWYLDEPVAELSAVGFLALSRLATQHVTVARADKARTSSSGATASTGSQRFSDGSTFSSPASDDCSGDPSGLRRIALLGCHPFLRPTTPSRGSSR